MNPSTLVARYAIILLMANLQRRWTRCSGVHLCKRIAKYFERQLDLPKRSGHLYSLHGGPDSFEHLSTNRNSFLYSMLFRLGTRNSHSLDDMRRHNYSGHLVRHELRVAMRQ